VCDCPDKVASRIAAEMGSKGRKTVTHAMEPEAKFAIGPQQLAEELSRDGLVRFRCEVGEKGARLPRQAIEPSVACAGDKRSKDPNVQTHPRSPAFACQSPPKIERKLSGGQHDTRNACAQGINANINAEMGQDHNEWHQ